MSALNDIVGLISDINQRGDADDIVSGVQSGDIPAQNIPQEWAQKHGTTPLPGSLAQLFQTNAAQSIASQVQSGKIDPSDATLAYGRAVGDPDAVQAGAQQSALAKLAPSLIGMAPQDQVAAVAKVDPNRAMGMAQNLAMWGAMNGQSAAPRTPQAPQQYGAAPSTAPGGGQPNAAAPQGYNGIQPVQQQALPGLAGFNAIAANPGVQAFVSPGEAMGMAKTQADIGNTMADIASKSATAAKALRDVGHTDWEEGKPPVPGQQPIVPGGALNLPVGAQQLPPTVQPPAMRSLPQGAQALSIPQVSLAALQAPISGNQVGNDGQPIGGGVAPAPPVDKAPAQPHLVASDGKPFVPDVATNFTPPDPTGLPHVSVAPHESSKLGMAEAEKNMGSRIDAVNKGNEAFTSSLSSLQNEQYRLKELANIYQQTQAGTATAQNVDLVNKAIGLGLIKNPAEIKDVGNLQSATGNAIMQIINQVKDTNNNMGAAPARLFGSEINEMLEKGGDNIGSQPQALNRLVGEALGFVNHHIDMVKGWTAIGGPGNRLQNGTTMLPDDYAQKFMETHDLGDYESIAHQQIGAFKGMPGNAQQQAGAAPQITKSYVRGADGKLVAQ